MKNVTKFLTAAFVIGVFCTINLSAQENKKTVASTKGVVITNPDQKLSKTNPVVFCWSSDENTAASYRLKVWQLMPGQSVETAMASNKIIVTTVYHAINTKGAGANDKMAAVNNSEAIKVCSESLQPAETSPATQALKTRTKSNNTNERQTNTENPQPAETLPAANVQKTKTKSNNANDRQTDTEPAQPAETLPAASALKTRTKSNTCNERQTGTEPCIVPINVDNFPACAAGSSCDYVFTVEALNAEGNPLNPNPTLIPIKFGWNVKTNKPQ